MREGGHCMNIKLLKLVLMVLLLVGCSNGVDAEIDRLKKENSDLNNQLSQVQEQNANLQTNEKKPLWANEVFPWLTNAGIKKITIKQTLLDKKEITKDIDDNRVLTKISAYLGFLGRRLNSPPNDGFHSVLPDFKYVMKTKDDKTFEVRVADYGVVQIGQYYFEAPDTLQNLGRAFMKEPDYLKIEDSLSKLANSGLVLSENNSCMESYRIQSVAVKLLRYSELLKSKPTSMGILRGKYQFYYYGELIELNEYESFVEIKFDKKVQYYKAKEGLGIGLDLFGAS